MLILFTVILFLFFPLVMLVLRLVRPKLNIQGFLAILVALAGWILIILARSDIPRFIPLLQWEPSTLFSLSPSLFIDDYSWYSSLALATLTLSVIIASIAQLGYSPLIPAIIENRSPHEGVSDPTTLVNQSNQTPIIQIAQSSTGWVIWTSVLALTGLGILAVTAGNILTLLLAWVAVDLLELIILLGLSAQSRTRERIIIAFSARMAGICIVLIAGVMLWSSGASLTFDSISQPIGSLLVIAAGLRLGVLPLHLPFIKGLPIDRNLGTILQLVPAISNYILLMRVSGVALSGTVVLILVGFTILAGIFAAVIWLRAKDELEGRPYWLLGTASLVVAAAILHQPSACLAWSIASLLSGGFIFSMFTRHKNLIPLLILGVINFSSLPFTPTWFGVSLYQFSPALGVSLSIFTLFFLFFLVIQAFLLAGFVRHALRGIITPSRILSEHTERWVWFFYPVGLVILVLTHLVFGVLIYRNLREIQIFGWIVGPVVVVFTGFTAYFIWRSPHLFHPTFDSSIRSTWDRIFSFDWLYRFLWRLFRSLSRLFSLFSTILEGDGGLLWALVIFGLIFVFMQK